MQKLQIHNKEGINAEKPNVGEEARLPMQTESNTRKGNQMRQKFKRPPRYFQCQACDGKINKRKKRKSKKQRACYICGRIGHKGNQCKQVNGCFICNKKGHLAIDCPYRNAGTGRALQFCLVCGGSGHNMFSCTNDYDSKDLEAIECYVCGKAGHLCCIDNKTERLIKATCYGCGQPGHFGWNCPQVKDVSNNSLRPKIKVNGFINKSSIRVSDRFHQPKVNGFVNNPLRPKIEVSACSQQLCVEAISIDKDEVGAKPKKMEMLCRDPNRNEFMPASGTNLGRSRVNSRWGPPIVVAGPYNHGEAARHPHAGLIPSYPPAPLYYPQNGGPIHRMMTPQHPYPQPYENGSLSNRRATFFPGTTGQIRYPAGGVLPHQIMGPPLLPTQNHLPPVYPNWRSWN
ncbi:uncharacterized protein LOC127266294 [Andrographis paniculata]|uniref:uncharacterized protein LOC127266294 n=1 Tax=Andrographis paniculata TaxID=175694 RepID=UPI0021E84299|nr:uncharacterized protein LOC127266294 [Andrographis paniculata]